MYHIISCSDGSKLHFISREWYGGKISEGDKNEMKIWTALWNFLRGIDGEIVQYNTRPFVWWRLHSFGYLQLIFNPRYAIKLRVYPQRYSSPSPILFYQGRFYGTYCGGGNYRLRLSIFSMVYLVCPPRILRTRMRLCMPINMVESSYVAHPPLFHISNCL